MNVDEVVALLFAYLDGDVTGELSRAGNVLVISFADGSERRITVE